MAMNTGKPSVDTLPPDPGSANAIRADSAFGGRTFKLDSRVDRAGLALPLLMETQDGSNGSRWSGPDKQPLY